MQVTDLGEIAPTWAGFRLTDSGRLWTPEGDLIEPGQVRAIMIRRQLIAELQRQLRLRAQYTLFPGL